MNFSAYRALLVRPEVLRLLVIGFLGRLPQSVLALVLMLHVSTRLGLGYGAAGVAIAVYTLGVALAGPWRGARLDRVGLRRTLVPTIIGEALIWSIAPWLDYQWLLPLAFIGGFLSMPIFTVMRQALAAMVHGEARRSAYSLDSVITELAFMIGPALGTMIGVYIGSVPALITMGLCAALTGIALWWLNPPLTSNESTPGPAAPSVANANTAGEWPVDSSEDSSAKNPSEAASSTDQPGRPRELAESGSSKRTRRFALPPWLTPAVLSVYLVGTGASLALAGTDVGIVAALSAQSQTASLGWVYACWCLGSALGGILYGAFHRSVSALLLLSALGLTTLLMAWTTQIPWLALASIVPGFFTAPVLSAASERVAQLVPERARGRAMGAYGSFTTVGAALGSPLAGAFADHLGAGAGFLAAGVGALAFGLIVIALSPWAIRAAR